MTSRTSAPTRTASTSPPTSTPSSATARKVASPTPARRSTRSPRRSSSPARRHRRWSRSRARCSGRSAASPSGRRSRPPGRTPDGNDGTEFFLSSTLGDGSETGNTAPSENRIGVWAITNTSSIDSASPTLRLSNRLIKADTLHAAAEGDAEGWADAAARLHQRPQRSVRTIPPRRHRLLGVVLQRAACRAGEMLSVLDSSDTRMNQVVYTGGRLFGAIGTGVQVVGGSTRAGVLWVNVDAEVKNGMLQGGRGQEVRLRRCRGTTTSPTRPRVSHVRQGRHGRHASPATTTTRALRTRSSADNKPTGRDHLRRHRPARRLHRLRRIRRRPAAAPLG